MRYKGKFLAVIMAVFMLFSILPTGGMAENTGFSDVDENTTVGKAVAKLTSLGIINGYEDRTFRPDQTITRAEFAKIIITFMGRDNIASDLVPSGFPDVDGQNGGVAHWAKKYIKLAADYKIVNGYEDGSFRPDANVSFIEAVKMLVCALGYGNMAQERVTDGSPWYSGYRLQANDLGILDNAEVNHLDDPASRGVVAILTYNSLYVEIATITPGGETIIHEGSTALEKYHGKTELIGVVTAVQQTGLDTVSPGLSKGEILVNSGTKTEKYRVPESLDTMGILGHRIHAYTQEGEDGTDIIPKITMDSSVSNVITASMQPEVDGNAVSFYVSDTATKETTVYLEDDIKFIYNGKYDKDFKKSDIQNIVSGNVELICNDGDEKAEVGIVTVYETFVVNSVDKNAETPKVYAKYNAGEIEIPYKVRDSFFSLKKDSSGDGAEQIIQSLAAWNVLSVARSKPDAGGAPVWKGIVSTKKLSSQKINGEKGNWRTLGSTEYEITPTYLSYMENEAMQVPQLNIGDTVTAYLDYEGKIAAAYMNIADSKVYTGYIINADYTTDGGKIQLYDIDGGRGIQILRLSKNVRVDGTSYTEHRKVMDELEKSAGVINANKAEVISGSKYNQLVYYSVNANNELEMIETITANPTPSDYALHLSVPYKDTSAELKYENGKLMNGTSQIATVTKAKVLIVPTNVLAEDKYAVRAYDSFFDDGLTYKAEIYNLNAVKEAKFVLIYGNKEGVANISADSPMMLLTGMSQVVDKETNVAVDKAEGYDFRTSGTMSIESEYSGMLAKYNIGDIFRYSEYAGKVNGTKPFVEYGTTEPIIYNKDGDKITDAIGGETADAAVAAAAEKRFFQFDTQPASSTRGGVMFGTILGRVDNTILFTPTIAKDPHGIQDKGDRTIDVGGAIVYLYDYTQPKDADKIQVHANLDVIKSCNDLRVTGKDITNATQMMVFYSGNENVEAIILFNYYK